MTVDSPTSHPHKLRLVPIPPPPPAEPREFDHPITTIAQAERFFRAMGCSRFNMDRSEYPERHSEYVALRIPPEVEHEWTLREARFLLQMTTDPPARTDYCRISDLLRLMEGGRFPGLLDEALACATAVGERLGPFDSLIMAESLIGRCRLGLGSGLIETCRNAHRLDLATSFALLARRLLDERVLPWANPGMQERRLEALARLEATQRFCGIWFDGSGGR